MADVIITGASRGIGRALALALGQREGTRLLLLARDRAQLDEVAAQCREAVVLEADLSSVAAAQAAGARLCELVQPGASLVHNAGLWPARRESTAEGWERAYAVNHLGPLALQAPLLDRGVLARVMVVSAGLIVFGRFDPSRTPRGDDFSSLRTYMHTKRRFAEATRELAARHPSVDFVVLHPGVVRTDLGDRPGPLGWVLKQLKRRQETPEACAARLVRVLDRPRWSAPGTAKWLFEDKETPWPIPPCPEALQDVAASSSSRQAENV